MVANVIAHTCKSIVFVVGVYFAMTGWPIIGLLVASLGIVALVDGEEISE
jgi:hypothetical protein